MKNSLSIAFPVLIVLLGGCTTVLKDVTLIGVPELPVAQADLLSDHVLVLFEEGCPLSVTITDPQCPSPIAGAICRPENQPIRFRAVGETDAAFGISFDSDFNPCNGNPNLEIVTPGVKVCTTKAESDWPGQGSVSLIIKYDVITGESCKLDPYLVLQR